MEKKVLRAVALAAAVMAGGPLAGAAGAVTGDLVPGACHAGTPSHCDGGSPAVPGVRAAQQAAVQPPPPGAVGGAATPDGRGLWVAWSNGLVESMAQAPDIGEVTGRLNAPIVDLAASVAFGTVTGPGYYLAAADGGVFTFGSASYRGSAGNIRLNRPIVGIAADPDGVGYWLAASDGGIFTYASRFHGSTGGVRLNQPIVGIAPALGAGAGGGAGPSGYLLAARDGGVFAFGDARFQGSTGNIRLNQPIVGIAADPDGTGYWLVAADGGVFAFGAEFHGSPVGRGWLGSDDRVVGIEASPSGRGYFVLTASGGAIGFGEAATVVSPPG